MWLAILGKYAPPLLLRFSNYPREHNNAARCLVDQLRTLLGENRASCFDDRDKNIHDPFWCASAIALGPTTTPHGACLPNPVRVMVKNDHHARGA